MQRHARKYLVLAFLAALTSGAFCLGKDDTVSPESLLAQAHKLRDVWSDGTPAVKVRTEIQIFDAKGDFTPGQYIVTWQSPSRWKEELEIANYKRIRVHDARGYWQQDPPPGTGVTQLATSFTLSVSTSPTIIGCAVRVP